MFPSPFACRTIREVNQSFYFFSNHFSFFSEGRINHAGDLWGKQDISILQCHTQLSILDRHLAWILRKIKDTDIYILYIYSTIYFFALCRSCSSFLYFVNEKLNVWQVQHTCTFPFVSEILRSTLTSTQASPILLEAKTECFVQNSTAILLQLKQTIINFKKF
jgi:hypothetical protein